MKNAEDEAFDELAKRQGHWGGGYQAKKAMAADKFCDANCVWTDHHPDCNMAAGKINSDFDEEYQKNSAVLAKYRTAAQPAQEPVALVIDGVLVKSALPEKYTGHLYTTPPQPAQNPIAWRWGNKKLNGGYEWRYTTYKTQPDAIPLYAAPPQTAQEQWNAALDEAANRIGEIAAFPKTTQDSFAVYIKGLKK
jgi:hypothetical protein